MAASKKKARKKVAAKKKVKKKAVTKKAKKVTKAKAKVSAKPATKKITRRKASGKDDSLIHGIKRYKAKKSEKYMNAAQIEHFRDILRAWRAELVDEINRTMASIQDETINHPDPNDRATQEADMSLELRSRDRERKLIIKIDSTLDFVENSEYGFCEKCGVEIGIARLEARPTATLCIDCKTLDEIREKQMI